MPLRFAAALFIALLSTAVSPAERKSAYSILPAKSKLEINVYKEGLFKAFGHDHLVAAGQISGQVQYDAQKIEDSSVQLKIAANSLSVVDPGDSEKDRQDVQAIMKSEKVLDAARFPEIAFASTGIAGARPTPGGWDITLAGKLTLHGVQKPVAIPVHVHLAGGQLQAQGEASLSQTDFGITPVRAGGGAVNVKDQLKITFTIVATSQNP